MIEILENPSGLVIKPSEGTNLVLFLQEQYFMMVDTILNSSIIRSERVVLNLQDWKTAPKDITQLLEDLQILSEKTDLIIALKWKNAAGIPTTREFEPAWVKKTYNE